MPFSLLCDLFDLVYFLLRLVDLYDFGRLLYFILPLKHVDVDLVFCVIQRRQETSCLIEKYLLQVQIRLLDLFYQFTCFKVEDHNFVGMREHSDQELVRVINLEI